MSREFGSYASGYFHNKIDDCANDALNGDHEITRLWGRFLQELSSIAWNISSAEACDSGVYAPIYESMTRMPSIKAALKDIEEYLRPFEQVAMEAIRQKEKESR